MSRPHAVGLKQSSLFALVTLFSLALANDTDLPSSIVGCKEVSCPYSTSDTCTLANKTFNGIGLARIPDVPSSLNGLSLVKGVGIPDPEDVPFNLSAKSDSRPYGARAYDSVYYLGAPPELDFSDLSGCAVTFNNASAEFDGKDAKKAKGTCPDILDQKCIDSITKRARDIVSNAKGDSCSALSRELKNHSFDECRGLTAGNRDRLGNFTVSFLNNLSPIFGSSNSSSDCWPIIPKSDNLAKISENLVLVRILLMSLYRPCVD